MVDADTVRRLALALPEVTGTADGVPLAFSRHAKGIAWTYMERVHPKKPRQARPDILAVRCAIERKELLLEAAPDTYFDDDHYRGYPAVLVRLAAIDEAELGALLLEAWSLQAPKSGRGRRSPPI